MSGEPADAAELRRGMTVRVVQGDQDSRSTDRRPIVGEVSRVVGDDSAESKVEVKNGAVGHVVAVVPDT